MWCKLLNGELIELGDVESDDTSSIITHIHKLFPETTTKHIHLARVSDNPELVCVLFTQPFFVDWLQTKDINWFYLSQNTNPRLFDFILTFEPQDIPHYSWTMLSTLPHFVPFVRTYPEYQPFIVLESLCSNPHPDAMYLFEELDGRSDFHTRIAWPRLSAISTPRAVELLSLHPECIHWIALMRNTSPDIVPILEAHIDKVVWNLIVYNRCEKIIEFVLRHTDQIYPYMISTLSSNSTNTMVKFLRDQRPDWINWCHFSANSNPIAMEILKDNVDKIYPITLQQNKHPDAIPLYQHLKSMPEYAQKDWGWKWRLLIANNTPQAVEILTEHMQELRQDWKQISQWMCVWKSPLALPILYELRDVFLSESIWENPSIFL